MLTGLNLDPNLNAIGTEPEAATRPEQLSQTGRTTPASNSRTKDGRSKLDIPYKAERDAFMACLSSETKMIGIPALSEKDARRIRNKHYRARMQLHANDVSMFNNVVVAIEQRGDQWYCTLTQHNPYQFVELTPLSPASSAIEDIETELGISD